MNPNACNSLRVKWFLAPRALALAALLSGALGLGPAASGRPVEGTIPLLPSVSWSWRLDVVASLLLVFIGALGWVVARFSGVNLRGRARSREVALLLSVVLLSLVVMAVSASIVVVAVGWTASGLLVTALIARAGTPRAPAAARIVRRSLLAGDLALWVGVWLWAAWLPTTDRGELVVTEGGWQVTVVAALLAVACVARTGLVPAHRWLPETAEAPSPVSALLHAGIVNGAGVLGVFAWPVFAASPLVLGALLALGLATVAVGAWSAVVRRDVKGRLAWSTTTQMGYMVVQLGLGLPAMALMHLIAHGSYKSWLFLRAGGAVERHRNRWTTGRRPGPQALTATAAVGVLTALAAPAATRVVEELGPTALVPLLVAVTAVALAGWSVAALERVGVRTAAAVVTGAGALGALYVWAMVGWEALVRPEPSGQVWSDPLALLLVLGAALVGVAVLLGCRRLATHPDGPFALALLPLSLTPGVRVRGVAPSTHGDATPASEPSAEDLDRVVRAVRAAAEATGPAWPLGAMVAANPLAGLERLPFADAVRVAEGVHRTRLRPSLEYYLERHAAGRISDGHLATALDAADAAWSSPAAVVAQTRALLDRRPPAAGAQPHGRLHEVLAGGVGHLPRVVTEQENVWSQLAWSTTTGVGPGEDSDRVEGPGPFTLWRRSAAHPRYDRVTGIRGAAGWVRSLPSEPAAAVWALGRMAGARDAELVPLLTATLAAGVGWAGHAAWRSREEGSTTPLLELVALRLAHDVLFTLSTAPGDRPERPAPAWAAPPAPTDELELELSLVWQRALELGAREWFVSGIERSRAVGAGSATRAGRRPASQSIWCIDVRSERIRRHLEAVGDHETFGFAGFFGAAVRYRDPDGTGHDLCPALIRPSHVVSGSRTPLRLVEAVHRTVTSVSRHPVAALAVAEGGGVLSGLTSLATAIRPAAVRRVVRSATPHGARAGTAGDVITGMTVQERTDLARSALLATGLVDGFAPVILVCGHGATIENNAFATAYDCGACGGHAGSVNAVLLAQALNDPEVRHSLASGGIVLPRDTVAVAALHDTTTDRVEVLGPLDAPDLLRDLDVAGTRAANERLGLLPPRRRRENARHLLERAADWSEPTPEWGLAGNAALVIGPRRLTRGAGLDGRVFLHSYEAGLDPDGAVLEQLLTAPLVVAQWINAQYYASAVAPSRFGSGDKTTHNVVGDVGVVTGAHGDLRLGLPWQALFRGDPSSPGAPGTLVHEPVRLSVVVAADPALILSVLDRHEPVRRLVTNEWITLLALDPDSGFAALGHDLRWRPLDTSPPTHPQPSTPRARARAVPQENR